MSNILTLGTFDGVHKGHQSLLSYIKTLAGPSGTTIAVAFETPPIQFFTKKLQPLLITQEHRLKLLKDYGVSLPILLPFTQEIADQTFEAFLFNLQKQYPFSHLVLGEGATFGKDKQGTPENVARFGKEHNIQVTYIPKTLHENLPISSGRIRTAVLTGDLTTAALLLGRPYSILAPLLANGTLDLPKRAFCLPPEGIYPVTCCSQQTQAVVSSLGVFIKEFPHHSLKTVEVIFN